MNTKGLKYSFERRKQMLTMEDHKKTYKTICAQHLR